MHAYAAGTSFCSQGWCTNFFRWITSRMSGWTAWCIRWIQGSFYYWNASKGLLPSHKAQTSNIIMEQYETAINKLHRTNNVSEDWHNRFWLVVSKHHQDIYTVNEEIQKEQNYTEIYINELAVEKKVKMCLPRNRTNYRGTWNQLPPNTNQTQTKIFTIHCSHCKYFIKFSFGEISFRENLRKWWNNVREICFRKNWF